MGPLPIPSYIVYMTIELLNGILLAGFASRGKLRIITMSSDVPVRRERVI